jgi:hypothetical protein
MPFILGLAVLDDIITPTGPGLVLATRTDGFLVAVPVGGVLADRCSRGRAVALRAGLAAALASPFLAADVGRSVAVTAVMGRSWASLRARAGRPSRP